MVAAAYSPDGSRFVTVDTGRTTAQIWNAPTLEPIGAPLRHSARITTVTFSPDGSRIRTGSDDKTARLWDAAKVTPIGEPMKHDARVTSVAFTGDGSQILTAASDGTVWRTDTYARR